MKTILFAASLLAIAHVTSAQTEIEQPIVNTTEATAKAFKNAYPDARSVNWDRICVKHDYTATFMSGEMETTVTYDENGKLLSTEKPILMKELPQSIADYMKRTHPGVDKYKKMSKTVDWEGNTTYEVEAAGKSHVFDKTGNYLRDEKE